MDTDGGGLADTRMVVPQGHGVEQSVGGPGVEQSVEAQGLMVWTEERRLVCQCGATGGDQPVAGA